jgi:hypothetical protein
VGLEFKLQNAAHNKTQDKWGQAAAENFPNVHETLT